MEKYRTFGLKNILLGSCYDLLFSIRRMTEKYTKL